MIYNKLSWEKTFNKKTWKTVLEDWKKGDITKMPINITKPFLWRTSPITKDKNTYFRQEFTEDKRLKNLKQDYSPFKNKPLEIHKKRGHDVLVSINLPKDADQCLTICVFWDSPKIWISVSLLYRSICLFMIG